MGGLPCFSQAAEIRSTSAKIFGVLPPDQHALAAAHVSDEIQQLRPLRAVVDVADHHVGRTGGDALHQGGERSFDIGEVEARAGHDSLDDLHFGARHPRRVRRVGIGEGWGGGHRGDFHPRRCVVRIVRSRMLRIAVCRGLALALGQRCLGHADGARDQQGR
jgi:hypothetical protein